MRHGLPSTRAGHPNRPRALVSGGSRRYHAPAMIRTTPFHPRTSALNLGLHWKEWAGYAAACSYDRHSEREYFAIRQAAALLDVSPLYKYDLRGPGAATLLSRLFTRDVAAAPVGRVLYGCLVDAQGEALDDGTVARIGPDWFRLSSSEPWLHWLVRHASRLDVIIEDTSSSIAALAIQGPLARRVLAPLLDFPLDEMRFFRVRRCKLAGHPVQVSRTGYTGDLGYEVWVERGRALQVWDAIWEEGRPLGLEPIGLDALDVSRIEAGFILQGVDYRSAVRCLTDIQKFSPLELGLGWAVDLDRAPFLGQARLRREAAQGPAWSVVGVELDWAELEAMHDREEVPPHLAPVACRIPFPIFDESGDQQVGQLTSSAWSPTLKRYLGLAQVPAKYAAVGTRLRTQYTVDFWRSSVGVRVVERPFFDPPRKRETPGRAS